MRNLRLNQAKVKEVLRILVNLGAESAVSAEPKITRVTTEVIGKEEGKKSESATDTGLVAQRIKFIDSIPLLRGLQVSGDERTNTLTLIGTPKLVEMAMSQIVPLDLRRRQVVINVKIIDVNLAGTQGYNTSFSFGVGNNFFTNDGGAASFNFGGSKPASAADVSNIIAGTPTATNPLSSANIFLNQTNPTTGLPSAGINSNPTQPGLTEFTEGTAGTPPKYTYSLPTLYQFPKKFLASLTAQVQSGNAKILTDPTLIVQEGQTADVQLTQDVIGDITRTVTDTPGGSREDRKITKEPIGLKLAVVVERIDDNGFVSLQVAPQVKSPAGTADTGNGQIILVSTRAITSGTIRLRDGQTLILSGIIQDQDRTTVSKLPILGDIPLLGALFRKTNRTNERREVIVLLTPQVMDDSERSSYGYNYTPSPQIRQILERRGLKVQPR
jgi:type IV pilus assembly protein PilQ